jgi:hypothetical protein
MQLAFAIGQNDLASQIQELISNLPTLPQHKWGFATSLINQFSRKGKLSDKQVPYVVELVALAKGQPLTQPAHIVGDLSGLISLFKTAGAKLKWPKVKLAITGQAVVLSIAGERSKAPGSVNVAGDGGWGERAWYGRISPEGVFDPSRSLTPEFAAALIPVLEQLASDPVAAVQQYGKLTGQCMFCGLSLGAREGQLETLTTRRSIASGMGETCAENWGLREQWKQASK